jgi:hypothetical protein
MDGGQKKRVRPAWDIILITLMLGGFAASATGVYLALRRVCSDLTRMFREVAGLARRRMETAKRMHEALRQTRRPWPAIFPTRRS